MTRIYPVSAAPEPPMTALWVWCPKQKELGRKAAEACLDDCPEKTRARCRPLQDVLCGPEEREMLLK